MGGAAAGRRGEKELHPDPETPREAAQQVGASELRGAGLETHRRGRRNLAGTAWPGRRRRAETGRRPPVAGSGEGVAGVGDGRTSRSMRAAGERVRRFGERGESGAHVDGGLRRQLGGPGGWEDRLGLSSPGRRAVERRRGCRALGRRRTRELRGPAGRPAGRAGPLLPGSQGRRGLSPARRVRAERPGSRTRVACG